MIDFEDLVRLGFRDGSNAHQDVYPRRLCANRSGCVDDLIADVIKNARYYEERAGGIERFQYHVSIRHTLEKRIDNLLQRVWYSEFAEQMFDECGAHEMTKSEIVSYLEKKFLCETIGCAKTSRKSSNSL